MQNEKTDEIYNTDNSRDDTPVNPSSLSDSDIMKKHKEFLNAIRTENVELIEDMIIKYQTHYDIINKVDSETGQTSLYLAAI